MRTLIPVLLLVGMFIAASFISAHYLDQTATQMVDQISVIESYINSGNWPEASEEINNFQKKWRNVRKWWAIIIDHAEIDNIEISTSRLANLAKTKATSTTLAEIAELKMLIKHIPEKELITLSNIL